jgi:hypothetical protein
MKEHYNLYEINTWKHASQSKPFIYNNIKFHNNDNGEIVTEFQMISQLLEVVNNIFQNAGVDNVVKHGIEKTIGFILDSAIKGLSWEDIENKLIDEIKPKYFNAHDCDTWRYATRNQLIIDNESIFKRDDFNRNKIIPVTEKAFVESCEMDAMMARTAGNAGLWDRAVEQAKKETITSDSPVFGLKADS